MSLTDDAHALIEAHFQDKEKALAVDATCGNGHDTAFLIELGFQKVMGFDVQEMAIETTRKQLGDNESVVLVKDSHANLAAHINHPIGCLMFNFGYLPSGDKEITTQSKSSITALQAGLGLLTNNGLISLMCYPGHPAGAQETQAIRNWFESLSFEQWIVETHLAASPKPTAPILYLIKRSQHELA